MSVNRAPVSDEARMLADPALWGITHGQVRCWRPPLRCCAL